MQNKEQESVREKFEKIFDHKFKNSYVLRLPVSERARIKREVADFWLSEIDKAIGEDEKPMNGVSTGDREVDLLYRGRNQMRADLRKFFNLQARLKNK